MDFYSSKQKLKSDLKTTGALYLIPTIIADDTQFGSIPSGTIDALKNIEYFLVENIRTARRFLSSIKIYESIEPLNFFLLDKDTNESAMENYFEPLLQGKNMAVLSESGCPGIADPGALAVKFAHARNIKVIPMVGPSSILLALMASGLNGQQFAFHGYLPVKEKELSDKIVSLEKESHAKKQTQIFIETPYRNNQLMSKLLRHLSPSTFLCIGLDLTGSKELIISKPVREWKLDSISFPKSPAVFLFLA